MGIRCHYTAMVSYTTAVAPFTETFLARNSVAGHCRQVINMLDVEGNLQITAVGELVLEVQQSQSQIRCGGTSCICAK